MRSRSCDDLDLLLHNIYQFPVALPVLLRTPCIQSYMPNPLLNICNGRSPHLPEVCERVLLGLDQSSHEGGLLWIN